MSNAPPEKTIRIGPCRANVWLNKTDDGKREFRSVVLDRTYRDDDGNWKSTNSFPLAELPAAIYALELARDYVAAREAETGRDD